MAKSAFAVCLFLWLVSFVGATQSTLDLFPSIHETYDPWILDPEHGYGSPYGGFGRNTQSRLAQLPLFLPNTDAQDPNLEPMHTEVRDSMGRLYVCRVYHEDELDPASLVEGMFEVPKLRQKEEATQTTTTIATNQESSTDTGVSENSAQLEVVDDRSFLQRPLIFRPEDELEDASVTKSLSERLRDLLAQGNADGVVDAMDEYLEDEMLGLCAQTHKGWWSYEWCYQESVTQFHVEINKATSSVQIHDITSLGRYSNRKVVFLMEGKGQEGKELQLKTHGDSRQVGYSSEVNHLAQGRPEIARVQDSYMHGTLCPGTGKERETVVNLVCCSSSNLQRSKGLVHRNNVHVATDSMAIHDVSESTTNICTYNVTVCTPLLCQDNEAKEELVATTPGGRLLKDRNAKPEPAKENESVMEILTRTLGGYCLQTATGGWWTYEMCHGKNVRQYHEVVGSKKNKDGAVYTARAVEADHNLGNYQTNVFAAIVAEDEFKFVVNATDKKGGTRKAYFELEYIGGDVCDHSDVTDAAIVAGGTTQNGISRASSVRYQCGDAYDISVREDSTCHYVVLVELPDLCKHPLFKEPVSKKQVIKCLHVPEDVDLGR